MGTEDMERQRLNVFRMRLLGAEVVGVNSGTRTLKDAINEAMRDWVTNVRTTHYLLGSVLGAHPYPMMVRDFHRVIGVEARAQILEAESRLPDCLVACVGGGSNAIGLFHAFLDDASRENAWAWRRAAAARRLANTRRAWLLRRDFSGARPGVLQGTYSYVLQTPRRANCHDAFRFGGSRLSGVGPEHAWLADQGRAEYTAVSDDAAVAAARTLARMEGIIPALESAHALAELIHRAPKMPRDDCDLESFRAGR